MDILLCGVTDAARALGLGRSKIYELIAEGQLETITIGRRRLIRTESIRRVARREMVKGSTQARLSNVASHKGA